MAAFCQRSIDARSRLPGPLRALRRPYDVNGNARRGGLVDVLTEEVRH